MDHLHPLEKILKNPALFTGCIVKSHYIKRARERRVFASQLWNEMAEFRPPYGQRAYVSMARLADEIGVDREEIPL